jgi:hypothetical protein
MFLDELRTDKKKLDFLRDIPGAEGAKRPFILLVGVLWDSSSAVVGVNDRPGAI